MQFAISSYLPFPISPFDISCVILITKSKNCAANELPNKKNDYYFKGLYKTTCYKTKSISSQFCFFSLTAVWMFVNFEKLIRFHRQALIVYKNGKNLKILIDIFRKKPIISKVILAFLHHLKPKNFLRQPTMMADI